MNRRAVVRTVHLEGGASRLTLDDGSEFTVDIWALLSSYIASQKDLDISDWANLRARAGHLEEQMALMCSKNKRIAELKAKLENADVSS